VLLSFSKFHRPTRDMLQTCQRHAKVASIIVRHARHPRDICCEETAPVEFRLKPVRQWG